MCFIFEEKRTHVLTSLINLYKRKYIGQKGIMVFAAFVIQFFTDLDILQNSSRIGKLLVNNILLI